MSENHTVDREALTEDQETCPCASCAHYRSVNRALAIWPVRDGYPDDKYREDVYLDQREAYLRGASDALVAEQGIRVNAVEWGVRHAEAGWEGSDLDTWDLRGNTYSETTALADAAKREGSRVVRRTVSAWREVN